jgi:hypothetical protein
MGSSTGVAAAGASKRVRTPSSKAADFVEGAKGSIAVAASSSLAAGIERPLLGVESEVTQHGAGAGVDLSTKAQAKEQPGSTGRAGSQGVIPADGSSAAAGDADELDVLALVEQMEMGRSGLGDVKYGVVSD